MDLRASPNVAPDYPKTTTSSPLSSSISYPWTRKPLIISAPMRLISLAPIAIAVSRAGGLGFIAGGTDCDLLEIELRKATQMLEREPIERASPHVLPIGVGFFNWGVERERVLGLLEEYVPAAVWFFAPERNSELVGLVDGVRDVTEGKTAVWVQVGTRADAVEVAQLCGPDVLVVQGSDAGGHGLRQGAGIVSLFPEVADALKKEGMAHISLMAAGGIAEGRGVAASVALGACGVVMGTRFLACREANIAKGYQDDVVRSHDGGVSTTRTSVYDRLRGTTDWPERFNARGIINRSFLDAEHGMDEEENKKLYAEAVEKGDEGWGKDGRMTAYAGTAVGLVKEVKTAADIVQEVIEDAIGILSSFSKY